MNAHRATNPLCVGLIATGDELTQGDILNTNGQAIAHQLHEMGLKIYQHIIVDDDEARIEHALHTLAIHNDIIIISGGLGPTSDDRTRFALAKALGQPLVFDEPSWQTIVARLQKAHLEVHTSNKQQAWFPEKSEILPNPNGTAAGCFIEQNNKQYFMLPGPPKECLPMFEKQVIPKLLPYAEPSYKFKWLLLGASEGEIAAKLDAALTGINCQTAYRWGYPYLEFKVNAENAKALQKAEIAVLPLLTSYLVSKDNITLEEQLFTLLQRYKLTLHFADNTLSQRILQHLLTAPASHLFSQYSEGAIKLRLSGFKEYWQNIQPPVLASATLDIEYAGKCLQKELRVYYRDDKVWVNLTAQVCKEVIEFLTSQLQ